MEFLIIAFVLVAILSVVFSKYGLMLIVNSLLNKKVSDKISDKIADKIGNDNADSE